MSIAPLIQALDPVGRRMKNRKLRSVVLQPTEENRKLLSDYEQLTKEINEYPARLHGLRMNYRPRDIPWHAARLAAERELKMTKLMAMEEILFAPNP